MFKTFYKFFFLFSILTHTQLFSQNTYPSKSLKLIVPFATGGAADLVARLVADEMSKRLGQTVFVENKPGAAGNIGTHQVAQSDPDGYTLLLGFDGTMVINPHIYPRLTFNSIRDFAPIGKIGDVPLLLVSNVSLASKNLTDLIELSKKQSGGISYGTAGTGSTQHLMIELLNQKSGSNFVHIPYKGASPAMTDVMGGHLSLVGAALAGSLEYIKAGKLKAFVISSSTRSKYLVDVPTFAELGLGDMVITAWHGLLAPSKTPQAVIKKLNAALNSILIEQDLIDKLDVIGSIASPGTPEKFADQIKNDLEKYDQIVKLAKIKIE